MLVAVIGTASSLALGTGTAALLMPGAPTIVHVFLGAAITATSVGITARVLKDMKASRSGEAKIILGAALLTMCWHSSCSGLSRRGREREEAPPPSAQQQSLH